MIVGGDLDNLNLQHTGDNSINHSPLKAELRGTKTLPLTRQRFVVKPLNGSQPMRSGKSGNVFPLLLTLQNLYGYGARKLFVDATVLFKLPHVALCIYYKWYVKNVQWIDELDGVGCQVFRTGNRSDPEVSLLRRVASAEFLVRHSGSAACPSFPRTRESSALSIPSPYRHRQRFASLRELFRPCP